MAKGNGRIRGQNLGFSDNPTNIINRISAPYDEKIRRNYELGLTFDNYTSGSSEINDVARFGKLQSYSYNSNNVDEWKSVIKD